MPFLREKVKLVYPFILGLICLIPLPASANVIQSQTVFDTYSKGGPSPAPDFVLVQKLQPFVATTTIRGIIIYPNMAQMNNCSEYAHLNYPFGIGIEPFGFPATTTGALLTATTTTSDGGCLYTYTGQTVFPNTDYFIYFDGGQYAWAAMGGDSANAGAGDLKHDGGIYFNIDADPSDTNAGNVAYVLCDDDTCTGAPPITFNHTHIVDFTPHSGDTVTGPTVDINEHIFINPDDLDGQLGIRLVLHNIDQNVLFLGVLSPSDIYIFDGEATTSGDVYIGRQVVLGDGNYRLEASLTRSYLYGTIVNPFSSINQDISHQFVVGTSTYIGTLSQNGFDELQAIFGNTAATSTLAAGKNCSPLNFDIALCLGYLFIPGGPQLDSTFKTFRDDVLSRAPWGYFGRTFTILSASTTAALPTYTVSFPIGSNDNLSTTSLSFDPGDMFTGAAALLTSTRDRQNGKNTRDVFEPFVQLSVALAVIMTIFANLIGSHRHHK